MPWPPATIRLTGWKSSASTTAPGMTPGCISSGPGGATPGKPVGLFYLGISHKDGTFTQKHLFKGAREENKKQAALAALTLVKEYLKELPTEN